MNGWEIAIIVFFAIVIIFEGLSHGSIIETKHSLWRVLLQAIIALFVLYKAGLFH